MAANYAYAIVALLLIYSHWIHAFYFSKRIELIKKQLLDEKPKLRSLHLGKTIGNCMSFLDPVDCVCDRLYESEKQLLCDGFITKWIEYHDGDTFESFLKLESYLPVPQIAKVNDIEPLACRTLTIGELDMEKRMYWCGPRRYKIRNTDDFGEIDGFFLAGSLNADDETVYAFRPPQLDSETVEPIAKLEKIGLLPQAAQRCPYCDPNRQSNEKQD